MNDFLCALMIPLFPLAGFVLLGIGGKNRFRKFGGIIGTMLIGASTIVSLYVAWKYFFPIGQSAGSYSSIIPAHYSWLTFTDHLAIDVGILLDPISVLMIVIVPFISLMVHLFSLAYMKGEERYSTYFAFLSLFTFSMLGLVLASNIFQTYIFWELVGVSSYLLIGFYYDRPSAVAAAKKAFIVTRFADLGFLIGILLISFYGQSLDFSILVKRLSDPSIAQFHAMGTASFLGISGLTWALALIFIGGAGKSAMFPLHIWLPDAMEGPTPVSALIHAATMVVAGVFLVARLFPIYATDAAVLQIITWTGVFSAIFAAVIACTQTDIKRVLAYSTMSQIGFMMFALGVTRAGSESGLGYSASMFHLFTHAFFKSLLFLCAGAIIHVVHSNELGKMGGLRKYLPVTHIGFLIGCLAISGIPPFSGFFSKEEILASAKAQNIWVYYIAIFTSGVTAFYMFRLYFSIFWSRPKFSHAPETGKNIFIAIPLIILSCGALLSGLVPFSHFVTMTGRAVESNLSISSAIIPVAVALAGIALAAKLYARENDQALKVTNSLGAFYRGAVKKFYVDEVYMSVTRNFIFGMIAKPAAWFDRKIIDGTVNAIANATAAVSRMIKGFQSGRLQQYILVFFAGVIGLALLFIYVWD